MQYLYIRIILLYSSTFLTFKQYFPSIWSWPTWQHAWWAFTNVQSSTWERPYWGSAAEDVAYCCSTMHWCLVDRL